MYQQLLGLPGMNLGLAKTFINEAFSLIQDEQVWSFQCTVGGWLTPGLLGGSYSGQGQNLSFNAGATFLSPGTITVQPYTNQITGDAVATAAWNNVTAPPLLTQQQIRVPYFSLYNIVAQGNNGTVAYATVLANGSGQTPGVYTTPVLDPATGAGATLSITVNADGTVTLPPTVLTVGSGYTTPCVNFSQGGTAATFSVSLFAVLTIDRPWMEPVQPPGSGYMIYMAYFPSPPYWKRWWNIRDTENNVDLDYSSKTQIDLAVEDAERTVFNEPTNVAYYGQDQRPGSATLGQQLWELWGGPLTELPYTFGCQCNWPPLVNPTDTLPWPLSDELVKWRALEVAYQWEESQKGTDIERGAGANWQFLTKAAREEYDKRLKTTRNMDRHIVDLYFTRWNPSPSPGYQDGFATQTGQLNIGTF
jgi:hypothetical protein